MTIKKSFNIVSDGSWLSLAQIEIFELKLLQYFPTIELNIINKADVNLSDIKIDFAVYSSAEINSDFFIKNRFVTVIERGLLNEIAIFNADIIDKIDAGLDLVMGTSLSGQTLMGFQFLNKALPNQFAKNINFDFKFIDGNIQERLNKLSAGEVDIAILSANHLNLLLSFEPSKSAIQHLLKDKKTMLLPLFECPPAAGQGALIIGCPIKNADAVQILKQIRDDNLLNDIIKESVFAKKHHEEKALAFGAFRIQTKKTAFNFASGIDKKGLTFSVWNYIMKLETKDKKVFSSTAFMKDFFSYQYVDELKLKEDCGVVFIASHKAIHSPEIKKAIANKRVWAAGTRSWFQLAKQGIWVEGCADGIGLEWLQPIFETGLVGIDKSNITIITNTASALEWQQEGWQATSSYELIPNFSQEIADAVSSAEILFWTSFQQYQQYKNFVQPTAKHACPAGKTADFLLKEGLELFIFPTIKAFQEW